MKNNCLKSKKYILVTLFIGISFNIYILISILKRPQQLSNIFNRYINLPSDISYGTEVCQTTTNLLDRRKKITIITRNSKLMISQLTRKNGLLSISEDKKKKLYSEMTIKINSLDLDIDVIENFMNTVSKIVKEINKKDNVPKISENSEYFKDSESSGSSRAHIFTRLSESSGSLKKIDFDKEKHITHEFPYLYNYETTSLFGPSISNNDLKIILTSLIEYLIKNYKLRTYQQTQEIIERVSEPLIPPSTSNLRRNRMGGIMHEIGEPSMDTVQTSVHINQTAETTIPFINNRINYSSILRRSFHFVFQQFYTAGFNYSFNYSVNLLKRIIIGN
uniref:Uncharacterized protein n=1 Tax=Tmesipteris elongata TaxID=50272 RepID=A0A059U6D5_TMEEL|nr:hypothetical protein [Tmesipteris elongata]